MSLMLFMNCLRHIQAKIAKKGRWVKQNSKPTCNLATSCIRMRNTFTSNTIWSVILQKPFVRARLLAGKSVPSVTCLLGSVLFKVALMCMGKPICTPLHLLELFPVFPWNGFSVGPVDSGTLLWTFSRESIQPVASFSWCWWGYDGMSMGTVPAGNVWSSCVASIREYSFYTQVLVWCKEMLISFCNHLQKKTV